jgi:ABC-type glycerol-3-phosphate transport system substrate-binding protein
MKKRILLLLSLLLVSAMILSSCAPATTAPEEAAPEEAAPEEAESEEAESEEAESEEAESEEPVTINVFIEGVAEQRLIEEMLPEFEEATGIQVNFEVLTYSVMREKLLTEFGAKENTYDVVQVDKQWVAEFVYPGWLEPLDSYIDKTPGIDTDVYIQPIFDMVGQVSGVTYLLPYYNYTTGLIYRTDLFEDEAIKAEFKEEYGQDLVVPTNREDYLKVAKFFTKPEDDFYGVVMELARGSGIHKEWSPLFFAEGGYHFDQDWNPAVDSEEGILALETVLELYECCCPEGATAYKFDDAFAFMSQGGAAMFMTYNWMLPDFNDPEMSTLAGNFALAPTPGGVTHLGAWGWGIPYNSTKKDAAWEFLSWVESFEIRKRRALEGGSPVSVDVLEDPEVLEASPYLVVAKEILAGGVPFPIYLGFAQQYSVLGEEFSKVVAEGKAPVDALTAIATLMDELVANDPMIEQYKADGIKPPQP